ncbi:MAG: hypothetical protein GF308_05100 [Candidatus Heimdallarchaeota archaeon]|nr:hypothetical protein [Candidatus Heimdallarchaeota archaeon]
MPNNSLEVKIHKIAQWIAHAKHLVAFTGAGISTESGLPDFRGPNGVWTRKEKGLPPPRSSVPWHQVQPNEAHLALVELQNMGLLKFLISQNVDNLHLKSGIKASKIAELHGNTTLMVCLSCKKKMTYEEVGWDKAIWGPGYRTSPVQKGQPKCPNCQGRIISSVVNFGDPLPDEDYRLAKEHAQKADVFLIIGSSLVVTPAANLPLYAIQKNEAKVILLNIGETPLDDQVDIKIEKKVGKLLTKIVEKVKQMKNFE